MNNRKDTLDEECTRTSVSSKSKAHTLVFPLIKRIEVFYTLNFANPKMTFKRKPGNTFTIRKMIITG